MLTIQQFDTNQLINPGLNIIIEPNMRLKDNLITNIITSLGRKFDTISLITDNIYPGKECYIVDYANEHLIRHVTQSGKALLIYDGNDHFVRSHQFRGLIVHARHLDTTIIAFGDDSNSRVFMPMLRDNARFIMMRPMIAENCILTLGSIFAGDDNDLVNAVSIHNNNVLLVITESKLYLLSDLLSQDLD